MKGKKLIIINEFLENKVGHYYEYDKSVMESFVQKGIPCTLYARSAVSVDIQEELKAIPHFTYTSAPWYRKIKLMGPLLYRLQLWRDLKKQITQIIEQHSGDLVTYFVPNIFWYNVLPYAKAFSKHRVEVVLLYRVSVLEAIDLPAFFKPLILRLFNRAFHLLNKNPQVIFASDSDVIAKQFKEKYDREMIVLPIPHLFETDNQKSLHESTFQFYLPGNARVEKGIENITRALEILQEKHLDIMKNMVIVLQFFGDKEKEILDDCRKRISNLSCTAIYLGKLTSDEYQHYFASSQAILIPYLNDHGYRARTSGILSEAIGASKPFITTKGSWMDVQVQKYNCGISVSDQSATELALAMVKLISHYPEYVHRSFDAKKEWSLFHNKENFYKIITDSK